MESLIDSIKLTRQRLNSKEVTKKKLDLENTNMNRSFSVDSSLLSEVITKENTDMNLSEHCVDKENTEKNTEKNTTYIKINNIKYKGYEVYYKKNIDNSMIKAITFNDNYKYFYKIPNSEIIKSLGKYKGTKVINSECRYYDIDYYLYVFDNDNILRDNKDNIYCIELPIVYDNMVLIEDLTYEKYSLYYRYES